MSDRVYAWNGITSVDGRVYARPDLLNTGAQVLARRDFVTGTVGPLAWNGLRAESGREWAQLDYITIAGPVPPPAGGWWLADGGDPADVLSVFQPIGAADLDASYWRLDGLAGNINLDPVAVGQGVAPTFDTAKGWGFNGSSTFLHTGISLSDMMLGAGSFVVRYSDWPGNVSIVPLGGGTSTNSITVFPLQGSWFNGELPGSTPALNSAAVIAMAGQRCFIDGIFSATAGAWSGSDPDSSIVDIGAWIADNDYMNGYIACIAFYKVVKSDAAIAAISAAAGALP